MRKREGERARSTIGTVSVGPRTTPETGTALRKPTINSEGVVARSMWHPLISSTVSKKGSTKKKELVVLKRL